MDALLDKTISSKHGYSILSVLAKRKDEISLHELANQCGLPTIYPQFREILHTLERLGLVIKIKKGNVFYAITTEGKKYANKN